MISSENIVGALGARFPHTCVVRGDGRADLALEPWIATVVSALSIHPPRLEFADRPMGPEPLRLRGGG